MLSNFHTHCSFCHGAGHPEEYVKKALNKGFSGLGFSCHGPAPIITGWSMSEEDTEEYLRTIDYLKVHYKNDIQIYKGMEIDYFSGDTRNVFRRYKLDYNIGSIHYINAAAGREYFSIDGSVDAFEEALNIFSGSRIEELVRRYYEIVLEMLQYNRIDILGHLDLVKKNNIDNRFFNEKEKWYVDLVKNVVEEISKHSVIVEVNTGGIARGYTYDSYPSEWIIRECKNWEIPITLSSDAHSPEDLDYYFKEAKEIIKSAGYNEIWELNDGKWISKRIL